MSKSNSLGIVAVALAVCALSGPAFPQTFPSPLPVNPIRDGAHDFDFEFGDWTMQLRRRLQPLSGSSEWVAYCGPSIVRKVWDGKANLGEIDVSGPAGRVQGLSLRTYNPVTRQWQIQFVSARDGMPTLPMAGSFSANRGEFYNQDRLGDRAILVRFIFSEIMAESFHFEQSFSPDGGQNWEVNWIANFRRARATQPAARSCP